LRRLRRSTLEGELEHGSNRHEHDQRIETVPAHEQPETPHAVNVLRARACRLLPEKDSKIVGRDDANQAFGGRGCVPTIRSVEASTDEEWSTS
jgi:hypothetical protein